MEYSNIFGYRKYNYSFFKKGDGAKMRGMIIWIKNF